MTTKFALKLLLPVVRLCQVLCVWFFLVLAFSAIPGFTHKVDVYFPRDDFMKSLPSDVSIVSITKNRMTIESPRSDLALRLYRAGAVILVNSEGNGCLDLRPRPEI
jgi:hypothetical protein